MCNWPDADCEICRWGSAEWAEDEDEAYEAREAAEAEAEYQAWRAKWEGRKGRFESPPDPWVDEEKVGEVPF